jgi:hypothetical protein
MMQTSSPSEGSPKAALEILDLKGDIGKVY